MNICPACQQCFEDVHVLCHHDQTPLVPSRPGACVIGKKYSLDQLLDQDLFTSLYAATLLESDRPVAITLLRPRSAADSNALVRFRREAHTIAHLNTRVNHQHVARTFDYGSLPDGGEAFIVTELVAGQTLREHIDETGQMPLADAVHIAKQIVEGLDAAHRCGVVHRNLSPANVILSRNAFKRFEVKIVDFGIARLREQRPMLPATDSERHHAALATLSALAPYVSPEQHAGEEPDGRSDLYSLGVILYEMLAGRLPFNFSAANTDAASDSDKKEAQQPPPLSDMRADVPEPLAQLVMQSLQSKRSSRPYSAAEFARLLRMDEHPVATQLKSNATAATATSVIPDADAATVHPHDVHAVKAVLLCDDSLPPAAAPVLLPFAPSVTSPPQQRTHVELEPEFQPQRAAVFQETIAPNVENKSAAQEYDLTPRKIIIHFDNETIFDEQEWGEEEASVSPRAVASTFISKSIPAAVPSAAPAKRESGTMKQTARRQFVPMSLAAAAVLGLVASWLAFEPVMFRSASSHAESSDASRTTAVSTANNSLSPADQATLQPPAAGSNLSQTEAAVSSSNAVAREPLPDVESASSNARTSFPADSETKREPSVDERAAAAQQRDATTTQQETTERVALRAARDRWLAATNERDAEKQMSLYMPKMDAFYSSRNASRDHVRNHKARVYAQARSIEMRAGEPEITFDRNGRTATMRFRKTYLIRGRRGNNRGEAVQELRWTRTNDGWRIASERNVAERAGEETAERSREARTRSGAREPERETSNNSNTTRSRRINESTRPRRVENATPRIENSDAGRRRLGKKG